MSHTPNHAYEHWQFVRTEECQCILCVAIGWEFTAIKPPDGCVYGSMRDYLEQYSDDIRAQNSTNLYVFIKDKYAYTCMCEIDTKYLFINGKCPTWLLSHASQFAHISMDKLCDKHGPYAVSFNPGVFRFEGYRYDAIREVRKHIHADILAITLKPRD